MTYSTGIKAWITNSQIVHTSAPGKGDTPFEFTREASSSNPVWPVFAHEPTASVDPNTGELVMFFTTNEGEKPGAQCGPPCTCGNNGTSCLSCPNDQQCSAE